MSRGRSRRGRARLSALALACLAVACASFERGTGAPPLGLAERQALRHAMADRPKAPTLYRADGQLTLVHGPFGEAGHTLPIQLLAGAAGRFRLTVLGPHGSALYVVVSDGARLAGIDLHRGRRLTTPATREGLLLLTSGLDIGLAPSAWLGLLTQQIEIPGGATANRGRDEHILWAWPAEAVAQTAGGEEPSSAAATVCAEVDAAHRLRAVTIPGRDGGNIEATLLPSVEDPARAVVGALRVVVADRQHARPLAFALQLDQVEPNPPLAVANPFSLGPTTN